MARAGGESTASPSKRARTEVTKVLTPASDFDGCIHWLVKAEPAEYSIGDFEKDGVTEWDGVRNHVAKNNLRKMKKGQKVLYYESNPEKGNRPGVVGRCTVDREDYPDPTQFDPKHAYFDRRSKKEKPTWACVDLLFGARLPRRVTLDELREHLPGCGLFRFARLSVVPLRQSEYEQVLAMAEQPAPPPPPKKSRSKAAAKGGKEGKGRAGAAGAKAPGKAAGGGGGGSSSSSRSKSGKASAAGKAGPGAVRSTTRLGGKRKRT